MDRQFKAAALAALMALALVLNGAHVAEAQKAPETPAILAGRFPTLSFPVTTLSWNQTRSVKAVFGDYGRGGQLVFTASWPIVATPDAEGAFHTRLKLAVRSTTGLRGEAIGFSQTSGKTPKLQVTVPGTRQQLQGTWFADVTAVDRFVGTLSNLQIKAALK